MHQFELLTCGVKWMGANYESFFEMVKGVLRDRLFGVELRHVLSHFIS